MVNFKTFLLGPKLYRIHNLQDQAIPGTSYRPNGAERKCDLIFNFLSTSRFILYYTTPIWAYYVFKKGYFTLGHLIQLTKWSGYFSVFLLGAIFIRGMARSRNQAYVDFAVIYEEYIKYPDEEAVWRRLRGYDYEFHARPVEFCMSHVEEERGRTRRPSVTPALTGAEIYAQIKSNPTVVPREFLAWVIAHTFGIRMVYPGAMSFLKAAYGSILSENRAKLIEDYFGIRAKLRTEDGNCIDTMFLDARQNDHVRRINPEFAPEVATRNSDTLVICCEGNAGFYEVGCMSTPMQAGYSVLGWNHPGFGESTGMPFPEAERNAIDIVLQYAIHQLEFQPENIMLMAWSIGGYPAIYACSIYPKLKGIMLDATFYDIMPFAKKLLPSFLDDLVEYTVRQHLNLNNGEMMKKWNFQGAIGFVRRTQDEVMNIDGQSVVESNMGNYLLQTLLYQRYPKLFDEMDPIPYNARGDSDQAKALWQWLRAPDQESRDQILATWALPSNDILDALKVENCLFPGKFPFAIGEELSAADKTRYLLYLADKHMFNFDTTHCPPLPASKFDVFQIGGFENVVRNGIEVIEGGESGSEEDQESGSDYEVVEADSTPSFLRVPDEV